MRRHRFLRLLGAAAIAGILVGLALGAALAQAQPRECLPFSQWGAPTSGPLMQGRDNTLKGDWYAVWCPGATPGSNGLPIWFLMRYAALDSSRPSGTKEAIDAALKLWEAKTAAESFNASSDMLGALWNAPNTLQLTRAIMSAALSANPVASLRGLVVVPDPTTGTKEFDDVQQLRYQACQQGSVLPPWPAASGVSYPLPAASAVITCTAPVATYVPPPVSTIVYIVIPSGSAVDRPAWELKKNAAGVEARALSSDNFARVRVECACDRWTKSEYGVTYCAVADSTLTRPKRAGSGTYATACMKQ